MALSTVALDATFSTPPADPPPPPAALGDLITEPLRKDAVGSMEAILGRITTVLGYKKPTQDQVTKALQPLMNRVAASRARLVGAGTATA